MAANKLYTRFAEVGRVVLVQYGPEAGKLATIVDIIDQNRLLIDGPASVTSVSRQVINMKWVVLTDFKLAGKVSVDGKEVSMTLPRGARAKTLAKFWAAFDVKAKFAASAWGKRLATKAAKPTVTDFARFQAKVARQTRAKAIRAKL